MQLIVAGSRNCTDVPLIYHTLSTIVQHSDIVLHGGARGVDRLAGQWCHRHAVACRVHLAAWERFGKSAGCRRNLAMAREADALIAFWDGQSPGTAHMIQCMEQLGKPVVVVRCAGA